MNLSSYLQMPPAPSVQNHTSNAVPQGPSAGVSTSAGNSLGFDFADVMARQLQRLVPQQRQTIAADAPKPVALTNDKQETRPVDARNSDRPGTEPRDTRNDNNADEGNGDGHTASTRTRAKHHSQKTDRPDVDALLEGLMQGTPLAHAPSVAAAQATGDMPIIAAPVATPITTHVASQATALQTVQLGPQMRIITDPKTAPSPESLTAFAKSMGLDESAIQDLLAQQPATPATSLTNTATAPQATPNALQAAMSTVFNGQTQNLSSTDSAVATQLAAMAATAEQPAVVSGAGLAAAATALTTVPTPTVALPGLTPTDMAAIQQLQITVLPAAVLPVNTNATPTTSTLEMLSLLGSGVDEQDVGALLSSFSNEAGSDTNSDASSSQGESNHFGSFAQALNTTNKANTATSGAAQASAAHMGEVYDQLSDKMATELAARMHKQLSDGEWKMKFALRPSNLGGVEIQLEMKDGKLDAVFRADNPLTRDLLQNSSQRLREALGNFGINAGQVNVGQGGGNTQQNSSGNSGKNSQVRDNSSSQVKGTGDASGVTSTRNKANASLLDLYA
jgi:flagellar hook-length control protein FliK